MFQMTKNKNDKKTTSKKFDSQYSTKDKDISGSITSSDSKKMINFFNDDLCDKIYYF